VKGAQAAVPPLITAFASAFWQQRKQDLARAMSSSQLHFA
jgi:hypothetical protein